MNRQGQAGMILPALLILVLIGALAYSFGRLERTLSSQTRQQQRTVEVLAKAREILRDYAQSHHLTHSGESVGYLPCPDVDNDGSSDALPVDCGNPGMYAIGRFPYRTLGSLPLRDGYGECLWYVVAGQFKNNPKLVGEFNWDNYPGQFIVRAADGRDLHPTALATDRAAALIISPGPPTSTQNRSGTGAGCNGNNTASVALTAFLEGGYAATSTSPVIVTQGSIGSDTNNDQIAWLAASDIFDARLARRSDFKRMIDDMLQHIAIRLSHPPSPLLPMPPPGNSHWVTGVEVGEVPDYPDDVGPRWHEHLRYLLCPGASACMTLNGVASCEGLLLFGGAATAGQTRPSSNDIDYFEDSLAGLAAPSVTDFYAEHDYSGLAPSQDLAICLPTPPPP